MTPKQFKINRPLLLQTLSVPSLSRVIVIAVLLLSTPVNAADVQIEQSNSSGIFATRADVQEHGLFRWASPELKRDRPLLATRSSCAVPARPARQLRVGGVGGGYQGPSPASPVFEPEEPGQSIQQSIGQTLAQPPKPAPEKSLERSREKSARKPNTKTSSSAAGQSPSKPSPKNKVPSQKKPTIYIIEMDDGQIFKGTMKPAGDSYLVATKSGILTVKIKNILRLKKALP